MGNRKITIAGTGCALVDFLYTNAKFNSPGFVRYSSMNSGDGGLSPGKLVFTEELEKFAGKPYKEILLELVGNASFNSSNIGGPSLVSLIHASQLLPENDFTVKFYGCTGNDDIAGIFFDLIGKTPLDISNCFKTGNKRTAFTDVLSDPQFDEGHGERTFVNNIGAAWDFTEKLLPESFFSADIVCFGGTALVPNIHDSLSDLLLKAKKNKCITVVNTVYDFRNEKERPGQPWTLGNTKKSYQYTDLLIMDCEEALKISGENTLEKAANHFKEQQVSAFIITNGSKDLLAFSNGKLFKTLEISAFPVSEEVGLILKTNPAAKGDTTGCGDNFAGGVISSLALQLKQDEMEEPDLVEAISWGVASGGFACFYVGGTFIEAKRGDKLRLVENLQHSYLKQIER